MNGLKQVPLLGFRPGVAINASMASFSSPVGGMDKAFSFASASAEHGIRKDVARCEVYERKNASRFQHLYFES